MKFSLCILVGKGEGKSFELVPGKEYTVGRHSENDIEIADENVSRNHFIILVKRGRYFITDLFSKNGTFVGGKDLRPGFASEVKDGVPVVIGMTVLGLGRMCQSCLKPFLDTTGFHSQENKFGEAIEQRRTTSIKRNLEFIYNLSESLVEAKDREEISIRLLDAIFNLFKRIDRCVILLIDDQTGEVRNIIYRSRRLIDDPNNVYNRELVEQALIMNRPVMVHDSSKLENGDDRVTESLQLMRIRSAMCVPIIGCFGSRGAIYVDSLERPNGFRKGDIDLLNDVGGRVAVAMDTLSLHMRKAGP